jgi:hypothetical protein
VNKSSEFGLVARICLGEDLLQLAAGRGRGYTNGPGRGLQAVTLGNSDCHLSLAAGEVERAPKRFNSEFVAPIGITDKYNSARSFSVTLFAAIVRTSRS